MQFSQQVEKLVKDCSDNKVSKKDSKRCTAHVGCSSAENNPKIVPKKAKKVEYKIKSFSQNPFFVTNNALLTPVEYFSHGFREKFRFDVLAKILPQTAPLNMYLSVLTKRFLYS